MRATKPVQTDTYQAHTQIIKALQNTANAIKLSGAAYPVWKGTINLTSGTAVQYKYIRKDAAGNFVSHLLDTPFKDWKDPYAAQCPMTW